MSQLPLKSANVMRRGYPRIWSLGALVGTMNETKPFFIHRLGTAWNPTGPRSMFFLVVPLDVGHSAETDFAARFSAS